MTSLPTQENDKCEAGDHKPNAERKHSAGISSDQCSAANQGEESPGQEQKGTKNKDCTAPREYVQGLFGLIHVLAPRVRVHGQAEPYTQRVGQGDRLGWRRIQAPAISATAEREGFRSASTLLSKPGSERRGIDWSQPGHRFLRLGRDRAGGSRASAPTLVFRKASAMTRGD